MITVTVLLSAFATYLAVYVLYHFVIMVANAFIPDSPEFAPSRIRRFNVIVPAHDEELYLPRLLATLGSQAYPQDCYRVTVAADNCTDGTVAACQSFDVDVLERTDAIRRGKGYAIKAALESIDLDRFDAVVIVDGDSLVNVGFLKHLNLQLERGDKAIQCYNGVANPGQTWFTRLMDISRTIANDTIHPGKRKLGLSSFLMGNGMCFDVQIIKSNGWEAFSVGEDWEYYARLVLSGAHIGYSRLARVYHQESVNLRQAASQRLRWSSGRFEVLFEYAPSLFLQGLRRRSLTCLDASLPLVFPNPSLGINLTVLGLTLAGFLRWIVGASSVLVWWFAALAVLQFVMFMIGVLYTEDKKRNALCLLFAPVFLAWKMGIDILSLCRIRKLEWKRTERRLS